MHADADWVSIAEAPDAEPRLSFQRAPDHHPPSWPDPASSMQVHLDFGAGAGNLDTAELAAIALGATVFEAQPEPESFRVLADPAGHVFCLCL